MLGVAYAILGAGVVLLYAGQTGQDVVDVVRGVLSDTAAGAGRSRDPVRLHDGDWVNPELRGGGESPGEFLQPGDDEPAPEQPGAGGFFGAGQ